MDFPIKLNDDYTCQGEGPNGENIVFGDLLYEGEEVGRSIEGGSNVCGPYGRVVRKDNGLWVIACTDEEEAERQPKQQAEWANA